MTINDYNQCVDDFSDGVYRFLLKNIRNKDIARDLVQDSFMKLWIKRKDVDVLKSKSYLFTTAYHTMIDHIRKNERLVSYEQKEDLNSSAENSYSDLAEILESAVQKLPDIQRSVLMLRDYEGYNYKEIGDITGLNESQVKVYIYRARLFLKNYLVRLDLVV